MLCRLDFSFGSKTTIVVLGKREFRTRTGSSPSKYQSNSHAPSTTSRHIIYTASKVWESSSHSWRNTTGPECSAPFHRASPPGQNAPLPLDQQDVSPTKLLRGESLQPRLQLQRTTSRTPLCLHVGVRCSSIPPIPFLPATYRS